MNWLKKAHAVMAKSIEKTNADYSEEVDVIEMDEIYTCVQKKD